MPAPPLLALAQTLSREWFTTDPVGQKVGLGIVVVVGLVVLYFVLRSMRWAAARWKSMLGLAVVIALLYYGAVFVFSLSFLGLIIAGMIAFGAFLGIALMMTHTGR